MLSWLKNHFIPHEGNDHQPHILRSENVLFIAIILAGLEIVFLLQAFFVLPRANLFALIVPGVLVDETNAQRELYNLTPLKPNPLLEAAATDKVEDMAAKGYFAHTSPDGLTPWYWIEKVGYYFSYAGENLAVDFVDSSDVTDAWMNSPSHKENILSGNFTEIGIAAAKGTYEGHDAVFVAELFGRPAAAPSAQARTAVASRGAAQGPVATGQPSVVEKTETAATSGKETFIAVKGEEVSSSPPLPTAYSQGAPGQANQVESLAASPRKTVNYVLYAASILTVIAIMLNIFIKVKVQHASLIVNGLLLLLLIAGIILLNQYVSLSQIRIL